VLGHSVLRIRIRSMMPVRCIEFSKARSSTRY
jgi:hypothetical protein